MYGRAEFDLLKLRVLHQSKKSQDRKHKDKHRQGAQADRLKKPRVMKHGTTFQHTGTWGRATHGVTSRKGTDDVS